MIRPIKLEDAQAICDIYNPYVKDTAITFEEVQLSVAELEERIRFISARYPWLVWEEKNAGVIGYAYISKWKDRIAYRFSAEISIYLKDSYTGKGIGGKLLASLLEEARKTTIHSLVSGITAPNERSVALHEKFGFKKTGQLNEIGFKLGKWQDVGYWELIL